MPSTARLGRTLQIGLSAEAGNPIGRSVQRGLAEIWREFEEDEELLIAIVHGAGGTFSVGHALSELKQGASPVPPDEMFPLNLAKPVIAAVEGSCHGLGFELALSCDLRVAGESASFGFPDDIAVPYRIASVLLPRHTFAGLSLELLLSGRTLNAREAQRGRLVTSVTQDGAALERAQTIAAQLSSRLTTAESFHKRRFLLMSGLPIPTAMHLAREPGRS